MRPVLYYVHHHGAGHWRRALALAENLRRPVVFASSATPPGPLPPRARFLLLPMDAPSTADVAGRAGGNGRLHWAPPGHAGLLARHRLLLQECERRDVVLAVVDVSVEVAVTLRTSGIPIVAVRLPGHRTDDAHRLGFALAERVVMPVPEAWNLPDDGLPGTAVGLVGRSGPRAPSLSTVPGPPADPPAVTAQRGGRDRVAVVVGRGGSSLDATVCRQVAAELPGYDVRVLGLEPASGETPSGPRFLGRVADAGAELRAATVVIGNAGLGTVCDVVAARRPFVVVPESRPFGEQEVTAGALAANGEAVRLGGLPARGGWRRAVEAARVLGPPGLGLDGAARFASLVEFQAGVHEGDGASPVPVGAAR